MKLLIVTQKVDINDPILGFFHRWIEEFARHFESIIVICLEVGKYHLPPNVIVLSLGKEISHSRTKYIRNFYKYIWGERKNYEVVFVHMNQEYVLLAGWLWCLLKKKVYLWRNHYAGSVLTDAAAFFCKKVFCTSRFSYTAKYKKTTLMPVGIDTSFFKRNPKIDKISNSILFIGRMARPKNPDVLLEALRFLKEKGNQFTASFYGEPLPRDRDFYQFLRDFVARNGMSDVVHFYEAVPNNKTVDLYNQHEIFVNLSPSGMYDKTIFEAMACESLVVVSNKNLKELMPANFLFTERDKNELSTKIEHVMRLSKDEKSTAVSNFRKIVTEKHSLFILAKVLRGSMTSIL